MKQSAHCPTGGHLSYESTADGVVFWKSTKEGPVAVPLSNFSARIVYEIIRDDGVETTHSYVIEAEQRGLPNRTVEVAASEYAGMTWVARELGASSIIVAGFSQKDHLRVAIQVLSGDIETRTIYAHTGWRQVGDRYVYLHGAGAIGKDGPVADIQTDLSSQGLGGFELPAPSPPEEARENVIKSLDFLSLAPDLVAVPLLCAVWRSVLGPAPFSIHMVGRTGAGKTELAVLIQQHFGPGMDSKHLPASWMSTANALEAQAFAAKDAVFLIDDFSPSGSQQEINRQHREAARLLRAQGNLVGRTRMKADTSLRPARVPRGLILSTGEEIPTQHSIRARILTIEVGPEDVDFGRLSQAQADAANGIYASVVATFLQWLAPRIESVRRDLPDMTSRYRDELTMAGHHRRTPDAIGDLAAGATIFMRFALDVGALSQDQEEEFWGRIWENLRRLGDRQQVQHEASNPALRILRLIASALASGEAHFASKDGKAPEQPQKWGWRQATTSLQHEPQGTRIGWVDGDEFFLDLNSALKVGNRMAGDEPLSLSAQTLGKRFKDQGLLLSTDTKRSKLQVRRMLEGTRRRVLHMSSATIFPD